MYKLYYKSKNLTQLLSLSHGVANYVVSASHKLLESQNIFQLV